MPGAAKLGVPSNGQQTNTGLISQEILQIHQYTAVLYARAHAWIKSLIPPPKYIEVTSKMPEDLNRVLTSFTRHLAIVL